MTNEAIARELMALGLRPVPQMRDLGYDIVVSVDEADGQYTYADMDGFRKAYILDFLPDLDDPATLGLVERWVRELWFAKHKNPAAYDFDISHFHDGNVDISIQTSNETLFSLPTDMPHAQALLAAARAAKGGG